MARTKSFDPDTVLDKAVEVFWSRGFEAASVEDLVAGTGVNRASLYGTFGDKKDLFLKAIDRYNDHSSIKATAETTAPVRAVLENLFGGLIERSTDGRYAGCLITNTVAEFGSSDPEILARVRSSLAERENALDRLLRRGQEEGDVPVNADIRARARHLLAAIQGIQVISKINPDPRALQKIADEAVESALR
ncbi:TetR/AcrR family transcriptional regulator [Rhodospirillaceae bacterium KN72]|uniref:TetR/AcrR family transcriptional regulator n=1 Tax=Pacificispira spongiicola TaxID=2729598 RepID=A0A7Y0HHI2_9PROT|nr:TetR/AcrR family transcriptional regulator [Pacificispira spongiicola]NMM45937.1 TetR/AcrR family transcriptional regulator [Pacificispira spongiicola]